MKINSYSSIYPEVPDEITREAWVAWVNTLKYLDDVTHLLQWRAILCAYEGTTAQRTVSTIQIQNEEKLKQDVAQGW